MKNCIIYPHAGVGILRFGMCRSEAQKMLDCNFEIFRRGARVFEQLDEVDSYDDLGVHLHYDCNNRLEFMEMFSPASPVLDEIMLFSIEVEEIMRVFVSKGFTVTKDESGLDIRQLGVGVYSENGKTPQAISVYRKGYYE
jgi:hypothetical protein